MADPASRRGHSVQRGDTITDFRGDKWIFVRWADLAKVEAVKPGVDIDSAAWGTERRTFVARVFPELVKGGGAA